MYNWLVRLQGHKFDLRKLATDLQTASLSVVEEQDELFLKSSEWSLLTDQGAVWLQAKKLVEAINEAAKIKHSDYHVVEADGLVIRVSDEGEYKRFVMLSGTATMRSSGSFRLTVQGASPAQLAQQPNTLEDVILLGNQDHNVKSALRYFNSQEHPWIRFYKAYEVIENDFGGESEFLKLGWPWIGDNAADAKAKIKLFKRTANTFGDNARHAHNTFVPPSNPMPPTEAEEFVRRIIRGWLALKGIHL